MKRKLARNYSQNDNQLLEEGEVPAYVIYARKSTDENSEKQTASIPQQIEKCKTYYEKENITLLPRPSFQPIEQRTIDEIEADNLSNPQKARELIAFYTEYWIVTERASAKEPFKRKVWRTLIEKVNKREIKGLLAYSPDRMSRNLQEGGELIQLVDNKLLGLRFSSFHFEDNAAGHMMLGFWLVFAEHYSRKLREDVLRGTEKKYQEGLAIGTRKWGYMIDERDLFIPDPFHFPILKKAFKRKIYDNWSDAMIADEMNKAGWRQTLKKSKNQITAMTAAKISNISLWYDPFYYGLYLREFKGEKVERDLRELSYQGYKFEPMLKEDEWELLQKTLDNTTLKELKKRASRKGQELDPLKAIPDGMLIFEGGVSFNFMLPNRKRFDTKAQKTGKPFHEFVKPEQIRYRYQAEGEEKDIELKWSDIDAKILREFKNINVSEEDYQAYLYVKSTEIKNKRVERDNAIKSIELRINKQRALQKNFFDATNVGIGLTGKQKQYWEEKDQKFEKEIKALEKNRSDLWEDTRDIIAEQREFCDLLMNLPILWQKATYVQKREILDILLLNIVINAKKELQINLKPELESLFVRLGGPGWN